MSSVSFAVKPRDKRPARDDGHARDIGRCDSNRAGVLCNDVLPSSPLLHPKFVVTALVDSPSVPKHRYRGGATYTASCPYGYAASSPNNPNPPIPSDPPIRRQ